MTALVLALALALAGFAAARLEQQQEAVAWTRA